MVKAAAYTASFSDSSSFAVEIRVPKVTYQYSAAGEWSNQTEHAWLSCDADLAAVPVAFDAWITRLYQGKPGAMARLRELAAAQLRRLPDNEFVVWDAWLCGLAPLAPERLERLAARQAAARAERDDWHARRRAKARQRAAERAAAGSGPTWPAPRLDRAAIDAILAAVEAAHAAPRRTAYPSPAIVGHNPTREDADLAAAIERRGGTIIDERPLCGVGTFMGGEARRLHYRNPEGAERWAYLVPHRLEIDAWGEESIVCSSPALDDPNALADAVEAIRVGDDDGHDRLMRDLNAIEAQWAPLWPRDFRGPRALPWLLKDATRIARTGQVRDEGLGAVFGWPRATMWEELLQDDLRQADSLGIDRADTEAAYEFAACLAIYAAAGLLEPGASR